MPSSHKLLKHTITRIPVYSTESKSRSGSASKNGRTPFRLSSYLITPFDLWRGFAFVVKRARLRDWFGVVLLVALALLLRLVFHISVEGIAFWLFFAVLLYWRLDSRISIGCALAGLVVIPVLLTLYNSKVLAAGDYWAERVAVWVYYFLCIGVIKQMIEYRAADKGRERRASNVPAVNKKSVPHRTQPGTHHTYMPHPTYGSAMDVVLTKSSSHKYRGGLKRRP